jgi:hypothetical protein
MKYLFILSLFILTLSSCSDVNDSNKDKIQLTTKFEIVLGTYNDSTWTFTAVGDTLERGKMFQERLIYGPGFKKSDKIQFDITKNNDIVMEQTIYILDTYAGKTDPEIGSTVALSYPARSPGFSWYMSTVKVIRNDSTIWSGKDSVYVK